MKLPHAQTLIKDFKARKVAEAQAAAYAKINKPARRWTMTSKKLPALIHDNNIEDNEGLVTRRDDEPTNPLDVSRYTKPTKYKRSMAGPIYIRHWQVDDVANASKWGGQVPRNEQDMSNEMMQPKARAKKTRT